MSASLGTPAPPATAVPVAGALVTTLTAPATTALRLVS